MPASFTLTAAAQQRRSRDHAAKAQAQVHCLEHHRALLERLARMSAEERRICYGLPPAPVRRLRTLPGMKTLAVTHVAAGAYEPVPELPRVVTAAWRTLWITGRSLALAFGGRAAV
jgi:hypothetical protein